MRLEAELRKQRRQQARAVGVASIMKGMAMCVLFRLCVGFCLASLLVLMWVWIVLGADHLVEAFS